MSVLHQIAALNHNVLKTRPDFLAQIRRHVQLQAQISEPHAGQVVHLEEATGQGGQRSRVLHQPFSGSYLPEEQRQRPGSPRPPGPHLGVGAGGRCGNGNPTRG